MVAVVVVNAEVDAVKGSGYRGERSGLSRQQRLC